MKKVFEVSQRRVWLTVLSTATLAFIYACGGDGGGGNAFNNGTGQVLVPYTGKNAQVEISQETANRVLSDMNKSSVPLCTTTGLAAAKASAKGKVPQALLKEFATITRLTKTKSRLNKISGTQPADILGDCGGSITYKNWSHSNGTTTATLSFADYCQNGEAGSREIISGDIPFVSAGTPGDSGPIMNKLTANAPKITVISKLSSGTVQQSVSIRFEGFEYTPGTPGAVPTNLTVPDTAKISVLVVKDELTGKQMKIENLDLQMVMTSAGGASETFSGRLCGSDNGCVNVDTGNGPVITDALGVIQSGSIIITGANNSRAVLTAIPGGTPGSPSFTVEVNGTAMSGVTMTCGGHLN